MWCGVESSESTYSEETPPCEQSHSVESTRVESVAVEGGCQASLQCHWCGANAKRSGVNGGWRATAADAESPRCLSVEVKLPSRDARLGPRQFVNKTLLNTQPQ